MNILDRIIEHKRGEVEQLKNLVSAKKLEQRPDFSRTTLKMTDFILNPEKTGIIAEFKRKSPSKGVINGTASVEDTTRGYVTAGCSALSVLTDSNFFGGSNDDLKKARAVNQVPIIRKDFTIDEYQVVEAKSIGADAILLIAAVMDGKTSKHLTTLAHSLGLQVLLEVHDEAELKAHLESGADLIGVNNRNLKTFSVSLDASKRLAPMIPNGAVKVSESGITSADTIIELRQFGYRGFLIGENFMKQSDPAEAAISFMAELRTQTQNR
ncbi:MAG TPA: indole-3-glycerol phosphate synthase TrpC [Chryseosolibacter sp.]